MAEKAYAAAGQGKAMRPARCRPRLSAIKAHISKCPNPTKGRRPGKPRPKLSKPLSESRTAKPRPRPPKHRQDTAPWPRGKLVGIYPADSTGLFRPTVKYPVNTRAYHEKTRDLRGQELKAVSTPRKVVLWLENARWPPRMPHCRAAKLKRRGDETNRAVHLQVLRQEAQCQDRAILQGARRP